MAQLHNKLALAPQRLPGPPSSPSTGLTNRLVLRLVGVAMVATVSVIGYQLGSSSHASLQLARPSSQSDRPGSASEQRVPTAHPLRSAALAATSPTVADAIAPQSDEQESRDATSPRAVSGRLTVGAVQPQQADAAARPTVSAAASRTPAGPVEAVDRSDNLPISRSAPLFQEFLEWRLKNHKGGQ